MASNLLRLVTWSASENMDARDVLVRECVRLLDALAVGLNMLKKHFPTEYEALKKERGNLWNF